MHELKNLRNKQYRAQNYIFFCTYPNFVVILQKNFVIMTHISKNQVKFVRSLGQKKQRDAEQLFIAEGEKCVREMLQAFSPLLIVSAYPLEGIDALEATEQEIEQMSQLRAPQGVIGVFHRPLSAPLPSFESVYPSKAQESSSDPSRLILALDGVQDPGNLGTIIRTADWYGITDIVCSTDTADCWNPKVVQATMGALSRVRVHYTDLYAFIATSRGCSASVMQTQVPIYGTLLDGCNMYSPGAIPQKHHGIIIMGNEGNGISPAIRQLITHPLFIPSYPPHRDTIESLNVAIATAIILSEFRR